MKIGLFPCRRLFQYHEPAVVSNHGRDVGTFERAPSVVVVEPPIERGADLVEILVARATSLAVAA